MPNDLEAPQADGNNDVVAILPSYAMPNISSTLPLYTNADTEFIHRTFTTGNYDLLKHLPNGFKDQQVAATRAMRKEATRKFLMPALSSQLILRKDPTNTQGLFSTFEYMPSEDSHISQLIAKEKEEDMARRLEIGGGKIREFKVGRVDLPKHKEFKAGVPYPRLEGPEEEDTPPVLHSTAKREGGEGEGEKLPPKQQWAAGAPMKLNEHPTRLDSFTMMNNIQKRIEQDWEGVEVSIFENETDCWVVRVSLGAAVDSEAGLTSYMNVFARCSDLALSYQLVKVVEFWGTTPGDGAVYYVFRPPWVKLDRLSSYYTLHPEERVSKARAEEEERAARRAERRRQKQRAREGRTDSDDDEEEGEEDEGLDEAKVGSSGWDLDKLNTSSLRFSSRINGWAKNFLTNEPAPIYR